MELAGKVQAARDGRLLNDAPVDVYEQFLATDAIFASPLTRAVETALVTLQHHPLSAKKGITLRSELREVKSSIGGRDTVGQYQGDEIEPHVHEELEAMFSGNGPVARFLDAASNLKRSLLIPIYPNNTFHEWWDSVKETN